MESDNKLTELKQFITIITDGESLEQNADKIRYFEEELKYIRQFEQEYRRLQQKIHKIKNDEYLKSPGTKSHTSLQKDGYGHDQIVTKNI